jgi:RNA-binding protein
MPPLSPKQVRFLRAASHGLAPVVMVGHSGLSENVLEEIGRSLDAHELIKIKIADSDRMTRTEMLQTICSQLDATAIHHIGKQLVVYRQARTPRIVLPEN